MKNSWLIAFFVLVFAAPAQAIDPSLDWKTLNTTHFYIHFAGDDEDTARRLGGIAERVHARLSPWIDWQPGEPTHIVLSDESDLPNGYASPIPFNSSVLYLTPPRGLITLEDYHDWLELLFTHEYLHVLHLDKATGIPDSFRSVFGRYFLFFPNTIQPRWFIEGLAVHHESDDDIGTGRSQSSIYNMLMRSELEGGLKPYNQVNQPIRSWPAGNTPYLYGSHFVRFIEQNYGEAALKQWIDGYSDNLIPAQLNSTARLATGKSVPQLWDEFAVWLQAYSTEQSAFTQRAPIAEGERLTQHGFNTRSIETDSEGAVYYVRNDHLLNIALMRRDADGNSKALTSLTGIPAISVNKTGDVLIAQPEVCRGVNLYYDLFRYNEADGLQRLTHCARYIEARWSPAGDQIVAVHTQGGESALHLLNANGEQQSVLWQGQHGETVGGLDWSPNGGQLVASIWRPQVGWNLETFDLATRQWSAITDSPTIELAPRYSQDGQRILFSAEYGGVYNIWQYDLQEKQFAQLTNVRSGAFQPVVTAEGTLYYLGNHPQGFDVYRLDQPQVISRRNVAPVKTAMPAPSDIHSDGEVSGYSPFQSLRPRWWLPYFALIDDATEVGFITGGRDAIGRHNYGLGLAADVDNGYPLGSLVYSYRPRNWVSLQLAAFNTNSVTRDNNDNLVRVRREDQVHLNAFFPFGGLRSSWQLQVGVSSDYESEQETATGVIPFRSFRDNVAGVGLQYGDTHFQPRSISRSGGRDVRLVAENSGVFDSDFEGDVYTFDWREFIRVGESEHVIGLRYARGHGSDRPRPFELGGVRSSSIFDLLGGGFGEPLINRRSYELRGYDDDVPGLIGRRMQIAGAEWRFPIQIVERGWMTPPLGLSRVSGRVFVENGAAWQDSSPDETFTSVGAELHADVNILYFDDVRLRMGVAEGLDEQEGETQFYLTIGGGF